MKHLFWSVIIGIIFGGFISIYLAKRGYIDSYIGKHVDTIMVKDTVIIKDNEDITEYVFNINDIKIDSIITVINQDTTDFKIKIRKVN